MPTPCGPRLKGDLLAHGKHIERRLTHAVARLLDAVPGRAVRVTTQSDGAQATGHTNDARVLRPPEQRDYGVGQEARTEGVRFERPAELRVQVGGFFFGRDPRC